MFLPAAHRFRLLEQAARRRLKQFFLPVGLIMAIIAALLYPAGGQYIDKHSGLKIVVIIIFLVSGYQTGGKALALNRRLFSFFLSARLFPCFWHHFLVLLSANCYNCPSHFPWD